MSVSCHVPSRVPLSIPVACPTLFTVTDEIGELFFFLLHALLIKASASSHGVNTCAVRTASAAVAALKAAREAAGVIGILL